MIMSDKPIYSTQLAELLHKMRNEVDGIYNAVLRSVDGLIIAEALPSTGDRTIGFYLANCLSLAQQIGKLLQIGDFDSVHLQSDADFFIVPVNQYALLCVGCTGDSSVLRKHIRGYVEQIKLIVPDWWWEGNAV
jgi:predicted regulator of Ras-like GTPase activity (Roadblock/LC7/MglB family)